METLPGDDRELTGKNPKNSEIYQEKPNRNAQNDSGEVRKSSSRL